MVESKLNKDQLKKVESIIAENAKIVFDSLTKVFESGKTLSLEFIRSMLQIYSVDEKMATFKDSSLKMLSTYKMQEHMKQNTFDKTTFYNENLDVQEFTDLISGKKTKEILFTREPINKKREDIEEYYKLYSLMGGTLEGISKENLAKCIFYVQTYYQLLAYKF